LRQMKVTIIAATALVVSAQSIALISHAQESGAAPPSNPEVQSAERAGKASQPAENSYYKGAKDALKETKTALKDTLITAKLETFLYQDTVTTGKDIHVRTNAGVVTLWGAVPNADASTHAEQLARQTAGVRDVVNSLQVKQITQ
jgi:hyperosmotically inducible protein